MRYNKESARTDQDSLVVGEEEAAFGVGDLLRRVGRIPGTHGVNTC